MTNNQKTSFLQQAARASWVAPIVTIVLMGVTNSIIATNKSPLTGVVISGIFLLLLLAGIVFGIVGCFGVKRHGAKTTLVPGLIGTVLNTSILSLLIAIAVPNFINYRQASPNNNISALQKLADQTNKELPVMLDSETRLDKVIVLGSDLIEYKYTIVNAEKSEYNVEELIAEYRPQLEEYYRTDDHFKIFSRNRIYVKFSYFDKSGLSIVSLVVPTKDASNK